MKTILIASIHGLKNIGGLERVNQYLYEILCSKYKVKVITGTKKPFKHGNWILQSIIVSLKLFFIPHNFVIGTSWHSFLFPCDITFHHGTMKGIQNHIGGDPVYSKRIGTMEQISAKIAKLNIAVGENVKDELIKLYNIPTAKIKVLNNFVNDSFFYPKNEYNNKENKIKILFVGRTEQRKGISELEKLSKYLDSHSELNYELHIACHTKNTDIFDNHKKTFLHINLSPDEIVNFYNSGDVFYFPTKYEGFSMSTLESLSCGTPVIGTSWAIGKELRNLKMCKIIESNDIPYLLNQISQLKQKFTFKRSEIHSIIKEKFGRESYEKKIFELLKF